MMLQLLLQTSQKKKKVAKQPSPAARECWTCKQMLPASDFYKSNTVKYYNCKKCENARHKARAAKTLQHGRPSCPKCSETLDIAINEKRFVYARCCDNNYRFQKKRGGLFFSGKAACSFCEKWSVCACFKLMPNKKFVKASSLDAIFKTVCKVDLNESK